MYGVDYTSLATGGKTMEMSSQVIYIYLDSMLYKQIVSKQLYSNKKENNSVVAKVFNYETKFCHEILDQGSPTRRS